MKKTGIVDPWRIVSPIKNETKKPSPKEKIDLSTLDPEREARTVPNFYIITCAHGSIEIRSKEIASDNDALCYLIKCIFMLLTTKHKNLFDASWLGLRLRDKEWASSTPQAVSASLTTASDYSPAAALLFKSLTLDEGLWRLIKVFNKVSKSEPDLLIRAGITTRLR